MHERTIHELDEGLFINHSVFSKSEVCGKHTKVCSTIVSSTEPHELTLYNQPEVAMVDEPVVQVAACKKSSLFV